MNQTRRSYLGARACLLLVLAPAKTEDLAASLGVPAKAVGRVLRRLAEMGMVEHDPNARRLDGRPYMVRGPWRLTDDYFPHEYQEAARLGLRAIRETHTAETEARVATARAKYEEELKKETEGKDGDGSG